MSRSAGHAPPGPGSRAGAHPVADAADRADEPSLGGVVAELATQVADVDVDQVLVPHPRLAPHAVDELTPGERHPGAFGESSQQATYDFGWTVDIPLANTL